MKIGQCARKRTPRTFDDDGTIDVLAQSVNQIGMKKDVSTAVLKFKLLMLIGPVDF